MNGYPADERQVVDRADRVSLAAGVVANFDLYNRQAKVPRRNGTARPRERQYRKARCSRNSFGTQARPQPFRLYKKLRPLLFVADATLTPGPPPIVTSERSGLPKQIRQLLSSA